MKNTWMRVSAWGPMRRGLDALGMGVVPYYLFLEKRELADLSPLREELAEYETGAMGPRDMPALAAMPGRAVPEAVYLERLRKGDLCLAMKHLGRPVSFVWAQAGQGETYFGKLPLTSREAYIYDAFTRRDHRGRGLAPYLRRRIYAELEKRGRVDLYSYSLWSNAPAVRLKQKLNAKTIGWGLHFWILHRLHIDLRLRRGLGAAVTASFFIDG